MITAIKRFDEDSCRRARSSTATAWTYRRLPECIAAEKAQEGGGGSDPHEHENLMHRLGYNYAATGA